MGGGLFLSPWSPLRCFTSRCARGIFIFHWIWSSAPPHLVARNTSSGKILGFLLSDSLHLRVISVDFRSSCYMCISGFSCCSFFFHPYTGDNLVCGLSYSSTCTSTKYIF
ncbi:hypothetical protein BS78_09G093600 [Paspalum vaginatum]|nr:hypothetical protein BS78_09G093600 [Paspalum vaginatum]